MVEHALFDEAVEDADQRLPGCNPDEHDPTRRQKPGHQIAVELPEALIGKCTGFAGRRPAGLVVLHQLAEHLLPAAGRLDPFRGERAERFGEALAVLA